MINELNRDLLFQRMAGGALRGSAAEEMAPMRRCTGKLENGRQCSTVPLPGEEMCSGCKKRGAALYVKTASAAKPFRAHDLELGKAGKPAKKGAVSEAQAELAAATASPILCRSCAGDGACDMSELGQTVCSAYCPEVAVPTEAQEQAAQAGIHPADLPITLVDIEAAADEFVEAVIQREAATSPPPPPGPGSRLYYSERSHRGPGSYPGSSPTGDCRGSRIRVGDVRPPRRYRCRDFNYHRATSSPLHQ